MKNIFIIHGSYGNPGENWFPWLKEELEKIGHRVFVPQFPVPEVETPAYGGHDLEEWIKKLEEFKEYINEETIFITHSRGGGFSFNFLPRLSSPIAATFLIAPWSDFLWYPEGWTEVDSFHKEPFDWEKIKKGSKYFELYQSTNDIIPVSVGEEIAYKLGARLVLVDNAGHFNASSGYTTFSLLLENIKAYLER